MTDPVVPTYEDGEQSAADPFSGAMRVGVAMADAVGDVVEVSGRSYSVVRTGGRIGLEQLVLDSMLEHPRRVQGQHTVRDVESFVRYIKRYQTEALTIWAGLDGSMTAVLNDHDGQRAGWGDHAVTLQRTETPEFAAWMRIAQHYVPQLDFAEFLEQRYVDIIGDEAADVLQMAKLLTAKRTLEFRQGQTLQTGAVDFMYSETISGQVREGQTEPLPTSFGIEVQPYVGVGSAVSLGALLRWRIDGQKLKFLVVFNGTELQEELDLIHDGDYGYVGAETGVTPFRGS